MDKLTIIPDRDGYAIQFRSDGLRVINDGVKGFFRRDKLNSSRIVDVTWILSRAEYAELKAFHNAWKITGGDSFSIDLLLHRAMYSEYKACFVQDSFKLVSIEYETFTVRAQLEVEPTPIQTNLSAPVAPSCGD